MRKIYTFHSCIFPLRITILGQGLGWRSIGHMIHIEVRSAWFTCWCQKSHTKWGIRFHSEKTPGKQRQQQSPQFFLFFTTWVISFGNHLYKFLDYFSIGMLDMVMNGLRFLYFKINSLVCLLQIYFPIVSISFSLVFHVFSKECLIYILLNTVFNF